MREPVEEIEVEVVEIDGAAPIVREPASAGNPSHPEAWNDWRPWQGRLRRLDSRWWPLWVILGMVLMVLVLTVGLFLALVFLVVRFCSRLLRALLARHP